MVKPELFFQEDQTQPKEEEIKNITVTEENVIRVLKSLKASSSPGPDFVPANLLKECAEILAEPLKIIYEESLKTGILPTDFKKAIISPIYKGGNWLIPKTTDLLH